MNNRDKENLSYKVVSYFYPQVQWAKANSIFDRMGIDGWLEGFPIQVKYDGTIAKSGNIYHEIYEKTQGYTEQKWRRSPCHTEIRWYFFVTKKDDSFILYRIEIDELAKIERDKLLIGLPNLTSIGFLIPIEAFRHIDKQICQADVLRNEFLSAKI